MDAVLLECLQLLCQRLARIVPVLEDCLEAFWGNGLDADQSALDVGPAHCVQVLAIFACLHRDLGEEDHVFGELRQLFHQLEALRTDERETKRKKKKSTLH